jgi:hypothetical protein
MELHIGTFTDSTPLQNCLQFGTAKYHPLLECGRSPFGTTTPETSNTFLIPEYIMFQETEYCELLRHYLQFFTTQCPSLLQA